MQQDMLHLGKPSCIWFTFPAAVSHRLEDCLRSLSKGRHKRRGTGQCGPGMSVLVHLMSFGKSSHLTWSGLEICPCYTGQCAALLSPSVYCCEAVLTAKHMTPTAVIQMRPGMLHLGKPCCIWSTCPAAVLHRH